MLVKISRKDFEAWLLQHAPESTILEYAPDEDTLILEVSMMAGNLLFSCWVISPSTTLRISFRWKGDVEEIKLSRKAAGESLLALTTPYEKPSPEAGLVFSSEEDAEQAITLLQRSERISRVYTPVLEPSGMWGIEDRTTHKVVQTESFDDGNTYHHVVGYFSSLEEADAFQKDLIEGRLAAFYQGYLYADEDTVQVLPLESKTRHI